MTNKATVSCGKFLDVAHVEELQKRFTTAIEKKPEVLEANTDNVERADSAGIQLLMAVLNQCNASEINLRFPKASQAVTDTLERLGLSQQITLN